MQDMLRGEFGSGSSVDDILQMVNVEKAEASLPAPRNHGMPVPIMAVRGS